MANDGIKIGVSGFAECATADPASRAKKLRPFKFRNKGEGAGRSAYYRSALKAIREFHELRNDSAVLRRATQELAALRDATTERLMRAKCANNIFAIEAYEKVYGRRRFVVLTNHRLAYRIGPITVTAQPDLWVEEDGVQVLIKIGAAKKKPPQADIMLYVIRKAAVASGYRVRARNIVYLDITNGEERTCNDRLNRFNRMFVNVANHIAALWPSLTEA